MIKRFAEVVLGAIGRAIWHLRLAPLIWKFGDRSPRVIMYHGCAPTESDFTYGLDVNTPPDVFDAQLEFFEQHYRVIPLSELEDGAPRDRTIVVTFDDGYRSVADYAAPLLAARDLVATVYLVTSVVDNKEIVWVNELNWLLLQRPDAAPNIAAEFLDEPADTEPDRLVARLLADFEKADVKELLARLWADAGVTRHQLIHDLDLYMTWEQVRALDALGWSFGCHTESHPDLRRICEADLDEELGRSVQHIRRQVGDCTSFAYPFGLTDERTTRRAEDLGMRSIMIVGGTNRPLVPHAIARLTVKSSTPAGIFSELEVIGPVKAWVRSTAARLRRREPPIPDSHSDVRIAA